MTILIVVLKDTFKRRLGSAQEKIPDRTGRDFIFILTSEDQIMARTPNVDQDICISCEICVNIAPGVFRMGDSGFAEVYDPTGGSEDKIQEAIDNCPVSCINWV